jgi:hypothetical protein
VIHPDAAWVDRHVPLHAHHDDFDLHAAVQVVAGDRARLAQLSAISAGCRAGRSASSGCGTLVVEALTVCKPVLVESARP